jgi:hypothetical protein
MMLLFLFIFDILYFIHSFIHSFSIFLSAVQLIGKISLGCRALQQADAIPTELRHTLFELRRTLLS